MIACDLLQIYPQSGANTASIIAEIVTVSVNAALNVYTSGIILIGAGRPEPPPTGGFATYGVIIVCICSLAFGICRRCAHSCCIGAKIFIDLIDTHFSITTKIIKAAAADNTIAAVIFILRRRSFSSCSAFCSRSMRSASSSAKRSFIFSVSMSSSNA